MDVPFWRYFSVSYQLPWDIFSCGRRGHIKILIESRLFVSNSSEFLMLHKHIRSKVGREQASLDKDAEVPYRVGNLDVLDRTNDVRAGPWAQP